MCVCIYIYTHVCGDVSLSLSLRLTCIQQSAYNVNICIFLDKLKEFTDLKYGLLEMITLFNHHFTDLVDVDLGSLRQLILQSVSH